MVGNCNMESCGDGCDKIDGDGGGSMEVRGDGIAECVERAGELKRDGGSDGGSILVDIEPDGTVPGTSVAPDNMEPNGNIPGTSVALGNVLVP